MIFSVEARWWSLIQHPREIQAVNRKTSFFYDAALNFSPPTLLVLLIFVHCFFLVWSKMKKKNFYFFLIFKFFSSPRSVLFGLLILSSKFFFFHFPCLLVNSFWIAVKLSKNIWKERESSCLSFFLDPRKRRNEYLFFLRKLFEEKN